MKKIGTILEADCFNGVREIASLDDADEKGKYYEEEYFYDFLSDLGKDQIITTSIMNEEMYDKIESEYGIK